jgi:hypothetical protein
MHPFIQEACRMKSREGFCPHGSYLDDIQRINNYPSNIKTLCGTTFAWTSFAIPASIRI